MPVPKILLKLIPVPKSKVRSEIAGEFMANFGLDDKAYLKNIQQAVADGLVKQIVVVGYNSQNEPKELFRLDFKKLEEDTQLQMDLSKGKSYLEALDIALAAGVAHGVATMQRRGLRAEFRLDWSDDARANPARLALTCKKLDLPFNLGAMPDLVDDPEPAYVPPAPRSQLASQTGTGINANTARFLIGLPTIPATHTLKTVLSVTTVKDTGVTYTHQSARRNR